MNPKFSLQSQYSSAWLILLAIEFSFHPNPLIFYQQMTKVQYERCHKDPTNEGCDAPHQPDTSSQIILVLNKKINKMKLKPTRTQSLGPDKISYINMKNNLLFHENPTDKGCDAPCPSDQSSYINMNSATNTQLMRGATPPTNQIQAAT